MGAIREAAERAMHPTALSPWLIGAVAAVGTALVLLGTPHGIGLSFDSAVYLGTARSLLAGQGPVLPYDGAPPMSTWGPLLPVVLAGGGLLGMEPEIGARWLHALLLGVTAFVTGFALLARLRSVPVAVVGTLLVALSSDLLGIHARIWSEPLYLALGVTSIALLAAHLERPRSWLVAASGLAVGLAFVTRYSAVVLVCMGVIGLVAWRPGPVGRRLRDVAVFAIPAVFPVTIWKVWARLHEDEQSLRELGFHLPSVRRIDSAIRTMSDWIVPNALPAPGLFLLAFLVALLVGVARLTGRTGGRAVDPSAFGPLPRLCLLCVVGHVSFQALIITILDSEAEMNWRHLSPVFVLGVILTLCVVWELHRFLPRRRVASAVLLAGTVVFVGLYARRAVQWVDESRVDRLELARRGVREAPIIQAARALPPEIRIYSNAYDILYLVTGRRTVRLPAVWNAHAVRYRPEHRTELLEIARDTRRHGGAFVFFDFEQFGMYRRGHLVQQHQVGDVVPLAPLYTGPGGSIHVVEPDTGTASSWPARP